METIREVQGRGNFTCDIVLCYVVRRRQEIQPKTMRLKRGLLFVVI